MDYKLLTAVILFSASLAVNGQNPAETRNFIKTFRTDKETLLEIDNKYGNVQITPWKKDSAMIRAEVKAYASSQSKADKMFEGVDIEISEAKYLIRARTEFSQSINMLFESFKGMTNKIIPYESRLEINYYISIPEYLNVKLQNRYGDVYMENITGDFTLDISNGSFRANSISKGSSLKMSFCDATINSLGSASVDANFSELNIGDAEDLRISSISSKFDIRKASGISCESRRDKFYLGTAKSLSGESYFSDFRIRTLENGIDLNTKYGNFDAENIVKGFGSVNITSAYTDVNLEFEKPASYMLDIRHINSFLSLPEDGADTEKKVLNDEKKEYLISGNVGKGGSSKVKIDANRGNIYLK